MSDDVQNAWIDPAEAASNLTRSQFLIWTGQRVDPGLPLYNITHATSLRGILERERFEAAFRRLIEDAEVLRTVIHDADGIPKQEVLGDSPQELQWIDLSDSGDPEARARSWVRDRTRRPMDPASALWDSALLRLAPDHHLWYLNQHHLVTDAWTFQVLGQRLVALYQGENPAPLPSYQDYVQRERASRTAQALERSRNYWRKQLLEPAVAADFYGASAQAAGPRTERVRLPLGRSRSEALRALAAGPKARMLSSELSEFRVFATLVAAFLGRLSAPGRHALGCPVHNRATAEDKATPGLYMELFPLWLEIESDDSFLDALHRSGASLMSWLANARPGTSTPQTNTAFAVVLNYLHARMPAFPGLETRTDWVHSGFGDRAHKLRIQVHDFDDQGELCVDFDFNVAVFDLPARQQFERQFLAFLDGVLSQPEAPVSGLELDPPSMRHQQLVVFNDTQRQHPDGSFLKRFLGHCQVQPERPALRIDDRQISYSGLQTLVARQVTQLQEQGVKRGDVVAVILPRCVEAVVHLLAVMAAGAASLPLDPAHPTRRLRAILQTVEDSHRTLGGVIAGADLGALTGRRLKTDLSTEAPEADLAADLAILATPDELAYVIFTSGSTGEPKGVEISVRAMMNYLNWASRQYGAHGPPAAALHTSLAVDLTVTSLYLPLLMGGEIVIYPDAGDQDLPVLRVFEEDAVDLVKMTPAHLSLISELGGTSQRIRTVVLGGEALRVDLVRSSLGRFRDDVEIFNEYGPTEATVGCMVHRFDGGSDHGVEVPIGQPIDNMSIYCLDDDLQPVPTGVKGELCIAGPGVADGYLGNQEETRQRFTHLPFAPETRIYRSGDLARWSTAGTLDFLGRRDQQVKLRGVRVEPGEVEAVLQTHPSLKQVVVGVLDAAVSRREQHCLRCGMPSTYPGTSFDSDGLCNLCRAWDRYGEQASKFFGTPADLERICESVRTSASGDFDAIVLVSGGKDSTYMLHQLADLNLRLLALTLDNGFLSEQALENARRSADDLGVEHRIVSTPHMNAIFADSLSRHSNVCHGCFKTIYTLALQEAHELGIKAIFTGLSRGQIFETRLDDLFRQRRFDVERAEQAILDARKVYHRIDDAVARLLDTELFETDEVLEEVRFIDFYRYVDVPLDEVYRFLDERAPWVRPSDTGRSTNCLINDVGIFIHRRERGFHNYALPYSWDVRLGHKSREAAMFELDDELDRRRVRKILDEVGYREPPARDEQRLVAWYVSDAALPAADLRAYLSERLPEELVPYHYVHADSVPLSPSGKVNRDALPLPRQQLKSGAEFVAPTSELEQRVASIWSDLLTESRIGVHDNFFDIGGRSLTAIQVAARLRDEFQVALPMERFFDAPTVAELADAIETELEQQIAALSDEEVERLLGETAQ